jgi:hypothetical protein
VTGTPFLFPTQDIGTVAFALISISNLESFFFFIKTAMTTKTDYGLNEQLAS